MVFTHEPISEISRGLVGNLMSGNEVKDGGGLSKAVLST